MHSYKRLLAILLTAYNTTLLAGPITHSTIRLAEPCGYKQRLLVIPGAFLPGLIGSPVNRIAVFKWSGTDLEPIPFQIDQRDEDNRYILGDKNKETSDSDINRLDDNDEFALLRHNADEYITRLSENNGQDDLIELEIKNHNSPVQWIYFKKNAAHASVTERAYMHYAQSLDTVSSETFKIGFSSTLPFLIDTLQWKTDSADSWSPDVSDIMKIRHTGKLFGLIHFERSAADYHSRLVAIKSGPIRIIRRTENTISMFWKLKSPRLLIDYVISPDGFIMDTIIDIPFPVGFFFSDLVTLTTMDWNSAKKLPMLTISYGTPLNSLAVDGRMSVDETAFNGLAQNTFNIDSDLGAIQVTLAIPDNVPITPQLYLRDDISATDAPEQDIGQFGNAGFTTTGWENMDTEVHHLKLIACLSKK